MTSSMGVFRHVFQLSVYLIVVFVTAYIIRQESNPIYPHGFQDFYKTYSSCHTDLDPAHDVPIPLRPGQYSKFCALLYQRMAAMELIIYRVATAPEVDKFVAEVSAAPPNSDGVFEASPAQTTPPADTYLIPGDCLVVACDAKLKTPPEVKTEKDPAQ